MLGNLFASGRSQAVSTIPLFPLRTVLFPGGLLPLKVFEQRYVEMTKRCMTEGLPFGVVMITSGEEVATQADAPAFANFGTLATITSWDMPQLGILNLVTEGGSRFNATSREVTAAGLALAEVTLLQEEAPDTAPGAPAVLIELLEKLIERVGADHFTAERHFDDPNWISYRLAEILPIKLSVKQKLLEVNDSEVRLRVIAEFLRLQGMLPR